MTDKYSKMYSVYVLEFPNGKRYVGCTRQQPEKRWRYGQGYRNTKDLYDAICSAGWENIKKIIIASGLDTEDAKTMEKDLIEQYKTQDREFGYNTKNGGQTFDQHSKEFLDSLEKRMTGNKYCVGRKLRPSHIEALRQSNIGHHRPTPNKGKQIHSEETRSLLSEMAKKRWDNADYREKMLNSRPDMSGKNNPMYGKHHSESTKAKISASKIGKHLSRETIEKIAKKNSKPVIQLTIDGNFIRRFDSIASAATAVNGNVQNICSVLKGKTKSYRGYRWQYADDNS